MNRKIFLAIPALTGELAKQTETFLACMCVEAAGLGWELKEFRWTGDSLIVHARNVCIAKFLESDCTDIMWLDSDVAAGPGVFTRLFSHRVDMVAGVYRVKTDEVRYPVRWLPDRKELRADPETGLLEVESVPFGLVRMQRSAVQKMVDADPESWFMANMGDQLKCWPLFNTEVRDRQFWGEDFYFCRKWRELGGKVWVDPELPLQHVDARGKIYAGHLGDWLRGRK